MILAVSKRGGLKSRKWLQTRCGFGWAVPSVRAEGLVAGGAVGAKESKAIENDMK
jgi:hypothetical protein